MKTGNFCVYTSMMQRAAQRTNIGDYAVRCWVSRIAATNVDWETAQETARVLLKKREKKGNNLQQQQRFGGTA